MQDNIARNEAVLWDACKELGLQEDVKIASRRGFRWYLDYKQNPDYPDFGIHMIKLEMTIRNKTGRPIELMLQPREDKNKRVQRNVLWDQTK